MKKYNRLIWISLIFYVLLAFFSIFFITHQEKETTNAYHVEINRIIHSFSTVDDFSKWNVKNYEWIEEVTLLKPNTSKEKMQQFFEEENYRETYIYPWYENEQFLGYLKFSYHLPKHNVTKIIWVVEITLFLLEVFILFILCYIKCQIIRPFHQISTLPEELSKGRFHGEVKVEKGKYFKNFLWGMSNLKDTLEHSKKRELEFMKERQQMLLSLSHDMKTPINIIKLYIKSLDENLYPEKEKQQEILRQIEEKTNEMEQYVEEITRSSREEIIDLPVIIEEFYLSELLETVLPIYAEQCAIRKVEFTVSTYQNYLMKGDKNRSQEVLENILENALKYGDGSKIEITFLESEYHHLIRITNTGNPVSENELNHLFDSFFRGKNAKGKTGSGLGLYICRELMHKMGGTIYAEIEKESMTFVLVFP